MAMRYNPPPGWEVPPEDWTPPQDWKPDPSWPAAPEGWIFWLDPEQRGKHRPRPRVSRKVVVMAVIVALLGVGVTSYSLPSRGPQGVALPVIVPVPTLGDDPSGATGSPRPRASKINGTATAGPTTGSAATASASPTQRRTTPVSAPTRTNAPTATATSGPTASPTPDCAALHPIGKYLGLCPTPTR
jgi:hypothetical protein